MSSIGFVVLAQLWFLQLCEALALFLVLSLGLVVSFFIGLCGSHRLGGIIIGALMYEEY